MTRATLIIKSTGEVIKKGEYPVADMSLAPGLDSDTEWLLDTEPNGVPEYDSRIFKIVKNESVTTEPHPVHTHLKQFQTTYSTEKKSTEAIEQAIKSREVSANSKTVPQEKFNKLVLLGLGIILKNIEGLVLNNKETIIKDKVVEAAINLWKNDTKMRDKIQALVDGNDPNIDVGWEELDVVDPPEVDVI